MAPYSDTFIDSVLAHVRRTGTLVDSYQHAYFDVHLWLTLMKTAFEEIGRTSGMETYSSEMVSKFESAANHLESLWQIVQDEKKLARMMASAEREYGELYER